MKHVFAYYSQGHYKKKDRLTYLFKFYENLYCDLLNQFLNVAFWLFADISKTCFAEIVRIIYYVFCLFERDTLYLLDFFVYIENSVGEQRILCVHSHHDASAFLSQNVRAFELFNSSFQFSFRQSVLSQVLY